MEFERLNKNINKRTKNPKFLVLLSATKQIAVGGSLRVRKESVCVGPIVSHGGHVNN